jgi:hypothetical protein
LTAWSQAFLISLKAGEQQQIVSGDVQTIVKNLGPGSVFAGTIVLEPDRFVALRANSLTLKAHFDDECRVEVYFASGGLIS